MTGLVLTAVGLLMFLGLVGVAVPVIPGLFLILAAGLWWVLGDGPSAVHWTVFAIMAVVLVVGTVLKYVVPARRTAAAGAATRSMVFAVVLGVVGFFVVPVVGAPLGFILGIYASERQRLGVHAAAWASTKAALKGVALSILIEFAAGAAMIAVWFVGLLVT